MLLICAAGLPRYASYRPRQQGQVQIAEVEPATRQAVTDAIHRHHPDVIHFYGHGHYYRGGGALLFDTSGGGQSWTSVDRLMTLFGDTRLVVLHACQGAMVGAGGVAGCSRASPRR